MSGQVCLVDLFRNNGIQLNCDFKIKHKAVIEQFGRYPHRNQIFCRTSTFEKLEFLKQPASGFQRFSPIGEIQQKPHDLHNSNIFDIRI